jgi:hypothetical protein
MDNVQKVNNFIHDVTDVINALPGNSYINTIQHAIKDEDVFSMSSAQSNSRNGVLCDQFLGYAMFLKWNCVFCVVRAAAI